MCDKHFLIIYDMKVLLKSLTVSATRSCSSIPSAPSHGLQSEEGSGCQAAQDGRDPKDEGRCLRRGQGGARVEDDEEEPTGGLIHGGRRVQVIVVAELVIVGVT